MAIALCSKDNANKKTKHQNIGVIKQSNLCNEIYQYTDEKTTAICTLSSMVLKNFIKGGKFDYKLLIEEVKKVVRALNNVVDKNNYSTEKGNKGGLEQRYGTPVSTCDSIILFQMFCALTFLPNPI